MNASRRSKLMWGVAIASLMAAANAHAQNAQATRQADQDQAQAVGEIVVTANRRAEALSKVSISVKAFS